MANGILDIETASRLRRFYFRSPSRVRGRKAGIHKSLYKGISPDFLEYKEYNRGDELRQVDWRLYGRHDRLYVKKFEDEVNLAWCILVDSSASMGYGEGGSQKLRYSESLAATLAYLLLRQGDAVGAGAFSGGGLSVIPPRAGNSYITPILAKLESLAPSGTTALAGPLLKALETFRQDASFVIISDLLTDEGEIEKSLQLLKAAKKETVIFHVLHEDETEFPFRGPLEFLDMESEERVIVDTDGVREGYRKRIKEFTERLKLLCHEYESRYVLSPTSRPVEEALIEIADK
ncbi:MAG: DUF58 domain-containing protein [Thermodesulfobacteriota bacterium]